MGRDWFLPICAFLQLNPSYRHDEAVVDPFWDSRAMTENFMKHCTAVAVPVGVSALDEKTVDVKRERQQKAL